MADSIWLSNRSKGHEKWRLEWAGSASMMRFVRRWLSRLFSWAGATERDREFEQELESHLAMHIDDNRRRGMSDVEARRQALIKLGGLAQTRERHREARGLPGVE